MEEFEDELKTLREEIKEKGEFADARLIASWLDRLIIAIENVTPAISVMDEEMSQVAEDEGCTCCMEKGMPKKKKAAKAKKTKRR